MKQKEDFMREAIRLSVQKMQEGCGGPFGCVVVCNGEIVARGYNNVLGSNDPTAHAEIEAIRKACTTLGTNQLTDCELYTSCEPCPMCLGAIYWARPKKVYYANSRQDAERIGFDDKFIYQELDKPKSERRIPMEQLLADEAKEAFEKWVAKEDKTSY